MVCATLLCVYCLLCVCDFVHLCSIVCVYCCLMPVLALSVTVYVFIISKLDPSLAFPSLYQCFLPVVMCTINTRSEAKET